MEPGKALKRHPKFQPSRELTEARKLGEAARNSGHPRPILSHEGLEAFFQVLENEERKVFNLQLSTGAFAMENAALRELLAELVENGAEHTVDRSSDSDGYACVFCSGWRDYDEEMAHEPDCLITRAKEKIG